METIKFLINRVSDDMCRITSRDIRSEYRKIADGACICDMATMLGYMQAIQCEVMEKYGNNVIFEYVDMR